MTRRLVLTIEQARELQRETAQHERDDKWVWPGKWKDAYRLMPPKIPHISVGKERIAVAVIMLEWGCSKEQIILHINWLDHAEGLQIAIARHERNTRKAATETQVVKEVLPVDVAEEPCCSGRTKMEWRNTETRWLKGSRRT